MLEVFNADLILTELFSDLQKVVDIGTGTGTRPQIVISCLPFMIIMADTTLASFTGIWAMLVLSPKANSRFPGVLKH